MMKKSIKKSIKIEAPAQWASALFNGDFSGLEPEEADKVRQWLKDQALGSPSMVEDPFVGRFEGLITDVATYVFLVD